MSIVQLLPFLVNNTRKIIGRKGAKFFLDLVSEKEQFYYLDSIYDFDEKKTISRLVLLLPGRGCVWAQKTGGCTMCGFSQKIRQIGKNFTSQDLIALYKTAEIMTIEDNPFMLTVYNGGSFINDYEIPLEVQKKICQLVKNHPTIKKLFVESRAEFVTAEKIQTLKKELGEKKLVVAIGLEAQDDKIRNIYINKGLTKETYEKAIKIIKQNGAKALTYVFIKPIYLSEREAMVEAIKTAEYAFRVGKTDEIAFESAFIQEGTLMEKLYREGKYKPPWLWSIIEVIKKTEYLGPIHLGGFEDEPPPIAIPTNCPYCSKKIKEAMQVYRETNNLKVFDNLYCDCKKEWEKIIKL
jgi:hypothetical protein